MSRPVTPNRWSLLRESRAVVDFAGLGLALPRLLRQPRGAGEPVLVLPGFGAGDASTLFLRRYLRFLGYDARGWDIGRNTGDVPTLIPRSLEIAERFAAERGETLRLVGWSLGGYLAREVARERPGLVERVVTLGTPVVGGPKYTTVAGFYTRRGISVDLIEAAVEERERVPIRVPVTAIYSRRDGIVSWQACIDRRSPKVEHVEVKSSHTGLGFHADAYRVIADRLARRRAPARKRRLPPRVKPDPGSASGPR